MQKKRGSPHTPKSRAQSEKPAGSSHPPKSRAQAEKHAGPSQLTLALHRLYRACRRCKKIVVRLPARGIGRIQRSTYICSFPRVSSKFAGYWLLGSAASVFGIVVFGGLTRLTESGLSITEWRPVTGSLPPMDDSEWISEFDKYRASPEFKLLNPNMTMTEFQKIYYMEWTHRLWGRIIGVTFFVPAIYLIARKRVSASMAGRILGIGSLIGFQGFLGWWMVKSGLHDDLFAPGSHPRVSQYRLVAHLGTAFLCYSAMLWNGLQILRYNEYLNNPRALRSFMHQICHPRRRAFVKMTKSLTLLIFVTALSGGFVAGLDAGLIYNDFPWMGQGLLPPREELLSPRYSRVLDQRDIWWRNALENPVLAQLDHRILATTTFTAITVLFLYTRLARKKLRPALPVGCYNAVRTVFGFAILQVTLGITTLLYLVPTPLASAHQAGALALLSSALFLVNRSVLPRASFLKHLKQLDQRGTTNLRKAPRLPRVQIIQ